MNKEENINKLKEFHLLINNYFDGKYEDKKTIKYQINTLSPIIQELLKKSNCFQLMSMAPPPAIGGMVIQNFNPFDMIFHSFWGTSIIPNISNMIEQSIGKYENDMVDFQEVEKRKTIKKCNIEYTDKITLEWLHKHVPLKIWIMFFGLLTSFFMFGYGVSNQIHDYQIKTKEIIVK